MTRGNRIENNHIYEVAAEYHGGVGIFVGYAQDTLIRHNQIDHTSYAAISLGWGGWLDMIEKPGVANNSCNNVVEKNLIFADTQVLSDGGCIYTQGQTGPSLAEGEKVIGNVLYDQFGHGGALYTDNGCNNVTAKSNVIFHTNHANWDSRHRNYYDGDGKTFDYFDCEDNYWEQGEPDGSDGNVTFKNNHIIGALDQAPASILKQAGLEPAFKGLLKRKIGHASAPEAPVQLEALAGDGCALVTWNPPLFEGGGPVESYTVTSSKGETQTISDAEFKNTQCYAKLSGLSNGTAYTFTVTARNANGTSVPSLPSEPVVPDQEAIQPPEAPRNVAAYPGNGMVSVHFNTPASDGGGPLIGYSITIHPGGRKLMLSDRRFLTLSALPKKMYGVQVVTGLENGKSYTFDVAAVNLGGEGAAKTTLPVTPGKSESERVKQNSKAPRNDFDMNL